MRTGLGLVRGKLGQGTYAVGWMEEEGEEGATKVGGKNGENFAYRLFKIVACTICCMVGKCSVNNHCDEASLHGLFNNDKIVSWQIRPLTIYKCGDFIIQLLMFAKSKNYHKLTIEKITTNLWQWSERARNIVGHI